jgi:hypothetical protein
MGERAQTLKCMHKVLDGPSCLINKLHEHYIARGVLSFNLSLLEVRVSGQGMRGFRHIRYCRGPKD